MENNLLLTGVDFGGVSPLSLKELKTNLESISDEKECILLIAEILKKGDFSVKPLLIELMNQTKDESVLNLCIRLFCSTRKLYYGFACIRFLSFENSC